MLDSDQLDHPISIEELNMTMKKLKVGKNPGPDRLSAV